MIRKHFSFSTQNKVGDTGVGRDRCFYSRLLDVSSVMGISAERASVFLFSITKYLWLKILFYRVIKVTTIRDIKVSYYWIRYALSYFYNVNNLFIIILAVLSDQNISFLKGWLWHTNRGRLCLSKPAPFGFYSYYIFLMRTSLIIILF